MYKNTKLSTVVFGDINITPLQNIRSNLIMHHKRNLSRKFACIATGLTPPLYSVCLNPIPGFLTLHVYVVVFSHSMIWGERELFLLLRLVELLIKTRWKYIFQWIPCSPLILHVLAIKASVRMTNKVPVQCRMCLGVLKYRAPLARGAHLPVKKTFLR